MKQIALHRLRLWTVVAGFGATLTACQDQSLLPSQPDMRSAASARTGVESGTAIVSTSPKPEWGPTITPQMLAVVEENMRQSPVPLYLLPPQEARRQPSIKDAVNALLSRNGVYVPPPPITLAQSTVPGFGGATLRTLVVTPRNQTGPLPVIVFYHGGGWVIANPDVYERSAVQLALKTGAIVVSVEYRKGPEFKFPTAHLDAYEAYKWIRQNAASLGGDVNKVAVAGESAGGNLSVNVCLYARNEGFPMPVHQLLVYPVANNDLNTESYIRYQDAKPLSRPLVEYFVRNYFRTPSDGDTPQISLVDVADLRGLPAATIIAAEIDPLQTDGRALFGRFVAAGVPVDYRLYVGTTHEFFGTDLIVPEAGQAQDYAAARLRQAFGR